jgi:dihydrofolate synthase/folylpolyglutamate synthase
MRRLCSLLGMPQNRFASIHVVGTNGKTSVTRMIAAVLESNGVSAGAYTSPHILDWRERIQIRGEPVSIDAFTRALERAEESAAVADRSAGEDGPVTQYELLTAAAFLAFAEARVEWAVIEAGLGGRLDATNVIPSRLTVLTSVGLDHTEWLGDTLEEIAAEKLAVLRDHSRLVVGEVPPEVQPVIERVLRERHAELATSNIADAYTYRVDGIDPLPGYQRDNMALATWAVRQVLAESGTDPSSLQAKGRLPIPGRAQLDPGDTPLIYDAAHNPDGARALAALLPELAPPRRVRRGLRRVSEPRDVVCCLGVLAEKDAEGIVEALAAACSYFVCTEVPPEAIRGSGRPAADSHPAERLAELCRVAGVEAEAVGDPLQAWERAKAVARERDAAALAAGSHYLLAQIWTERPAPSS